MNNNAKYYREIIKVLKELNYIKDDYLTEKELIFLLQELLKNPHYLK